MRALGVALAACGAMVLWPSALHANPIGPHDAADRTRLATVPGSEAFDGDDDADDGAFTAQAGLDNSVHFAATGTLDAFSDDHVSMANVVDVEGLATISDNQITLALRTVAGGDDNDKDDMVAAQSAVLPAVAHGPSLDPPAAAPLTDPPSSVDPPMGGVQTSATPEPASLLLLATGLLGVLVFRRQLFA